MSWVNIVNKSSNNVEKNKNKLEIDKNKSKTDNKKQEKFKENYNIEVCNDLNFEMFKGSNFFDDICDIVDQVKKYYPDLLSKCTPVELYFFFKNHIIVDDITIVNSESEEELSDDYY